MMQSTVNTVALQPNASRNASPVYMGHETLPVRLALRNTGAVIALLAYASSALNGSGAGVGGTYALPVGAEVVFVLQPRQQVWGISSGAVTQVSYHASVALPIGGLPL